MSTLKTQPSGTYRAKLQHLCNERRLKLLLVIAPPRTNSTVVEHMLGHSPSVQQECHEPFFGAGRTGVDPDNGYKQIYDSIGAACEQSPTEKTVVVKDIAHWVSVDEAYKELFELTDLPIVFLIRNPLLSVESRLRKVLSTVTSTYEPEPFDVQARSNGYKDWSDLLAGKFATKDYRFFETLLQKHAGWATTESDFGKMEAQINYLKSINKPFVVVDTTDLRANPNLFVPLLCAQLQITFSPLMINWEKPSADFYTTQDKDKSRPWYDAVQDSTCLKAPIEIPPPAHYFPATLRTSVLGSSLPIYYRLAAQKMGPAAQRRELNELEFEIEVTAANSNTLIQLGVINDPTPRKAHVSLADIDPIYALNNDPSLLRLSSFRQRKIAYKIEFSIA